MKEADTLAADDTINRLVALTKEAGDAGCEALLAELQDAEGAVQTCVAQVLMRLPVYAPAKEPLLRALVGPDGLCHLGIAEALARFPDPAVNDALIDALTATAKKDVPYEFYRCPLVAALAKLNDPRVAPALAHMTLDTFQAVRKAASEALRRLVGDTEAERLVEVARSAPPTPKAEPQQPRKEAGYWRGAGLLITSLLGAAAWFLIGSISDLDKASRRLDLQEKQEHGEKLSPDEKAEWERERVSFFPQIAVRVATRPLWAGLIAGVFVGLWGLVCWGLSALADPGMTGEYLAARGTAIIGGLVGALIGGLAGLVGGVLAWLFPVSVGLAVFGLFFGCALWCVVLTMPKRPAKA
jgi:hypothetical protein